MWISLGTTVLPTTNGAGPPVPFSVHILEVGPVFCLRKHNLQLLLQREEGHPACTPEFWWGLGVLPCLKFQVIPVHSDIGQPG